MNKKNKAIKIGILVFLVAIGLCITFYFLFRNILFELGGQVLLETENYDSAIEVNSDAEFILLLSKEAKVSNIIYLNNKSVQGLYHKKIEGKKIEKAIPMIIENLKNENLLDDTKDMMLIDYGNPTSFSEVVENFNKQLIIYGINKQITTGATTLKEKLESLGLEVKNDQEKDLKTLYYHSLDIISKYQKNETTTTTTTNNNNKEEPSNINQYAVNVYNKLLTYASSIKEQSIDDMNGIDITTINATGDYEHEVYATSKSWYYIKDYQVYVYLNFSIGEKSYDYCFLGNSSYTNTVCPQ